MRRVRTKDIIASNFDKACDKKQVVLSMGGDSACLGFAAFLKYEFSGIDLRYKRRSEIYMNCLIVHLC